MEFTPHGVCSKNIHLEVDEAGVFTMLSSQADVTVTYRASDASLKEWIFTKQFHVSKVSNADTKQHPARISFHLL